jgi:3,5-epimerase/4-reductase
MRKCCNNLYIASIHTNTYKPGIYTYDNDHPIHSGIGFTETSPPNFTGSFYSLTKATTERLLTSAYSHNVLVLRIRMPVSDTLHPRSFVTKISGYEHVVNIPNSHSILHDLLPCSVILASHNETGVYNFVNPGAISHNQVLTLYKKYIDPGFTWKNFSLEEQAKILKADRSNCELDTGKLVRKMRKYGVEVPDVFEGYERCFQRMADGLRLGNAGVRNRGLGAGAGNAAAMAGEGVAKGVGIVDKENRQTDGALA